MKTSKSKLFSSQICPNCGGSLKCKCDDKNPQLHLIHECLNCGYYRSINYANGVSMLKEIFLKG